MYRWVFKYYINSKDHYFSNQSYPHAHFYIETSVTCCNHHKTPSFCEKWIPKSKIHSFCYYSFTAVEQGTDNTKQKFYTRKTLE